MLVSDFPPPKVRPLARRYVVNDGYFDPGPRGRLTPDQAYWLGYLLADGCVAFRKRDGVVRQFVLQAASKDKEHLLKLRQALSADYPLYGPHAGCWQLAIPSYRLCLALERYGVVPNKSFTATPPALTEDVANHWIRGVIDGDGHFGRQRRRSRAVVKNGKGRPGRPDRWILVLAVSGSWSVTEWFLNRFGGSHCRHSNIWRWSINDSRAAAAIEDAYRGSSEAMRLDRKFDLAVSLGLADGGSRAAWEF